MTTVLAAPVLARQVAAIQVSAHVAGDPGFAGHTWRWQCTCDTRSLCTFPTAADADLAGTGHICREVTP